MALKSTSQPPQESQGGENADTPVGDDQKKKRRRSIVIAAIVVGVILAVAGVAIYVDQVAPFRITVATVNDASIRMRTFLARTYLSGEEPLLMLQSLSNEEIIRQVAPTPPYNIRISEDDIDEFLRKNARGNSDTLSESDFKAWYREQLNESRMSSEEFKDLVTVRLLMQRLSTFLAERVPSVAEQVKLSMILIQGLDAARAAKARLDAGESFAAVAREVNTDENFRENGGDFGWHVRESLNSLISRVAFDELAVNEVSAPFNIEDDYYALLLVSERAAARELDEDTRRRAQSGALDTWLRDEQKNHSIEFHGLSGPYDSETDAWVKWQLLRMKR